MYPTDGLASHHEGVKNEGDTIIILNKVKYYDDVVIPRGGTRNKSDAVAGDIGILIKKKQGIRNGAYEMIKTSKHRLFVGDHFDEFLEDIKEHRDMPTNLREVAKPFIERDFKKLCFNAFNKVTTDTLIQFLTDTFVQPLYHLAINDVNVKKLYIFPLLNHPVSILLKEGAIPFLFAGRGIDSQQVLFRLGDKIINDGVRLRINSNNGISPMLKLNKGKNNNSYPCIRIQQDNVLNIIKKSNPDIIDYKSLV